MSSNQPRWVEAQQVRAGDKVLDAQHFGPYKWVGVRSVRRSSLLIYVDLGYFTRVYSPRKGVTVLRKRLSTGELKAYFLGLTEGRAGSGMGMTYDGSADSERSRAYDLGRARGLEAAGLLED